MPLFLMQQNKLNLALTSCHLGSSYAIDRTNSQESQKDKFDKKSILDKQLISDEDEGSEQTEFSSFSKVIDQETAIYINFNFSRAESVKFLHYNSKDKVQYHPEFSTPPPKNLQA
jgi:hypothetical protein